MFGLEDQKKKKAQEFVFEIEKELKDSAAYHSIQQLIEKRLQKSRKSYAQAGLTQRSLIVLESSYMDIMPFLR